MRVLLISDSYPPLVGGATRSTQQLAHQLLLRGHQVTVVTAWQRKQPTEEDDQGVQVFRVRDLTSRVPGLSADPYRHTPPPWPDPEAVIRLRRIIRSRKPDVVQSYGWLTYSAAVALLGMRVPLIVSVDDYGLACAKRTFVYRDGSICGGPRFAKCLSCSRDFYGAIKGASATVGVLGGRHLLGHVARGIRYNSTYTQGRMRASLSQVTARAQMIETVIPPFAEPLPNDRVPDSDLMDSLPRQPFILFVGALRIVKGVDVLVRAYGRLVGAPPLVLIGPRAPDTPVLDAPGVQVIEGASNATVMAAWRSSLFGVAPSRLAEPYGLVVHEAMSQGRPVIGTSPGGHADMIVQGVTGLLVPAGDVEALTRAMQRLIDEPELRQQMGVAAAARVLSFNVDDAVSQYEDLYRRAARPEGR